jgi:hypothetical protein
VKREVEKYLRSAEGRSFPKVATDVLLDIKGCSLSELNILSRELSGVFRLTYFGIGSVYTIEPIVGIVYG